ncbi:MAG: hypothetical protein ACYC6Y_07425 [Thermoguttaceae bacterium]
MYLAVEDQISEAMLRAVLAQSGRTYSVGCCYQHSGFGYLKTKIGGFNHAAKGTPFLVLTDLDRHECAPELISKWLPVPKHPNLVFRVAVREVESWVLADREAFASLLGVRSELIPSQTDEIADAKRFLLDLVRRSRKRELRDSLLPSPRSTAKQGPDYNRPLVEFVEQRWRVQRAAKYSRSLKRTLDAVRHFQPVS